MKAAAGAFIQAVHEAADERAPKVPQWARVYRSVRRAIDAGALLSGVRLPSARQLAREWRVARGAVDEAFAQLQLEGLIERRIGDGTYVAATAMRSPAVPPREPSVAAQGVLHQMRAIQMPPSRIEAAMTDARPPLLHPRGMPLDSFPLQAWRRLLLQAHDEGHRALLGGGAAAGLPALRAAIVRHLALNRGVSCTADQVLVIGGPREGVTTITRQLLQLHDTVAVEDPSHPSLPQLFATLGQHVLGVPLDAQGFDVGHLQRFAKSPRAVYLHPLSHYPNVQRTSVERGDALLDWAAREQAWIIEGQYNDEWVAASVQPRSLFSRDRGGRVVAMNTFEGVMFPAIRVGYLVLPRDMAPSFIRAHARRGERVPLATQWALAQFIDGGLMNEHLRQTRELLRARRDALRSMLAMALPQQVRVGAMDTGAQVCLHLPDAVRDTAVAEALRQQRIIVEPVSRMVWQTAAAGGPNAIVLGYMGWSEAVVLQAAGTIGQVLTELLRAAEPVALPG